MKTAIGILVFLCVSFISAFAIQWYMYDSVKQELEEQRNPYFTWRIVCFDENWLWGAIRVIDEYEQTDNVVFWSWFDFVKMRCEKVR